MHEKFGILINISQKFIPKGQINNTGSDNGLAPNRQQAIFWTNADPLQWLTVLGGE